MKSVIFNSHEISALLAGQKTQFRKPIKFRLSYPGYRPKSIYPAGIRGWVAWQNDMFGLENLQEITKKAYNFGFECPYGKAGDQIYVKELWATHSLERKAVVGCHIAYKQDRYVNASHYSWKSPAIMPEWASRIVIKVVKVEPQELQNITEQEAEAEGAPPYLGKVERQYNTMPGEPPFLAYPDESYIKGFRIIWDMWNKKNLFESNPWVWAVSFEISQIK